MNEDEKRVRELLRVRRERIDTGFLGISVLLAILGFCILAQLISNGLPALGGTP